MSVTAISARSSLPPGASEQMALVKQNFDALGSALQSGNLDDAKKAFAELEKNAPARSGNKNNPASPEMDALKKALDSDDLKGAQDAWSTIQDKMSQGRPAGAPAGGNPQKGGSGGGNGASSASGGTTYDKMDLNKDGKVSEMERLIYERAHPGSSSATSTIESDGEKGEAGIDTYI